MAGGLIQIASYGLHDIFLVGNPQITFFKIVYRRHTNFAMEYKTENFTGIQNFGNYLSCNLSKMGDLLHKLYLKIDIPQVSINRSIYGISEINTSTLYDTYREKYVLIQNFINQINFNLIQPLYTLLKINGLKYVDIKNKYNMTYKKMNYINLLNNIKNITWAFTKTFRLLLINDLSENIIIINEQVTLANYLDFNAYYIKYITSNSVTIIDDLTILLDNYILQINIIKTHMYNQLIFYEKLNKIINRTNINFSWVEYVGHQLINRVEIEIGGKVIDFTDSVRMNIDYQLSNKIEHDKTFNKIIGNIPELTTYNDVIKPAYSLYIPLNFWFTKYSGLSIPLIYMRYHDIKINIQLNDLVNCCYYETLKDNIYIEDLINLNNISLIANYIYLDSDERKKFAQLEHEYLIEQSQVAQFTGITTQIFNFELPFFNLIKQLFWIIRDQDNINRLKYFDYANNHYIDIYSFESDTYIYDETNSQKQNYVKVRMTNININTFININDEIEIVNSIFYSGKYIVKKIQNEYIYVYHDYYMKEIYNSNYTFVNGIYTKTSIYQGNTQAYIIKRNNSNPIQYSTLEINGIQLFNKKDGIYTNYVNPYQYNIKAPDHGLNVYSFALNPEEYQPSGFCNFNALDLKSMTFYLDQIYQNKDSKKNLNISIYAHGYNILKFAHGKAGIIFNIFIYFFILI